MTKSNHGEVSGKHVNMSSNANGTFLPTSTGNLPAPNPQPVSQLPCPIPTFTEASRLVSAPYSCLVVDTHRRHIALPPMYLKKKRSGIQEELNTDLLRYSDRLKGVPMAYDGIRVLSQHGDIYDDNGYIHLDIEVTFVVFQPSQGQKLLGKVNKIGVNHVGCLVHDCFNASIPKPDHVSVDTWRDAGPKIGTELEFEVLQIDADSAGVLLIRGRLDRTKVQELLAIGESSESSVPTDQLQPLDTEPSTDDTPKKKKKKKKHKVKEEVEEKSTIKSASQPDSSTTMELNGSAGEANGENVGKKRKKEKKEKQPKEETTELKVSLVEVPTSDSSGYLSDRPSKKRKTETVNNPKCLNGDSAIPKLKKLKTEIKQFA